MKKERSLKEYFDPASPVREASPKLRRFIAPMNLRNGNVATLLAQKMSTQDISGKLNVAPASVEKRIRIVLDLAKVATREQFYEKFDL